MKQTEFERISRQVHIVDLLGFSDVLQRLRIGHQATLRENARNVGVGVLVAAQCGASRRIGWGGPGCDGSTGNNPVP